MRVSSKHFGDLRVAAIVDAVQHTFEAPLHDRERGPQLVGNVRQQFTPLTVLRLQRNRHPVEGARDDPEERRAALLDPRVVIAGRHTICGGDNVPERQADPPHGQDEEQEDDDEDQRRRQGDGGEVGRVRRNPCASENPDQQHVCAADAERQKEDQDERQPANERPTAMPGPRSAAVGSALPVVTAPSRTSARPHASAAL